MVILEMNCKVCGNTSAKNTSVSFFRFPKKNSKCRDWADRCDLLGLFETHGAVRFHKSFRICSQHFDPKHVFFDGRKNRLLDSAIPRPSALTEHPSNEDNPNNFGSQLPQNLCRLCAEQDDNVTDIFGRRGRLLDLETKLKYFPQVINKHDILPLKICNRCVSKVNQFYDFILNCTRAETKLRAMLDTKLCNPSPQVPKSDAHPHDKPDCDSGMEAPKLIHCPDLLTSFPNNIPANSCDQLLLNSFTGNDTAAHTMRPQFGQTLAFHHDHSNVMSADQLLPVRIRFQPDDQSLVEETKFACHVCRETFGNCEALSGHSAAHARSPPTECLNELCDEVFCSRFPFERASRAEEGKCVRTVCDKNVEEVAFVDNHLRPRRSGRESETKTRVQRFREPDRGLEEKFSKKRLRPSHEETQSEESHQCSECGKFFRSRASLRQHRSVHSEKRVHDCRECGMSFKRKDTLCNHLRIHTGERPFMCKVCGFAFKQRGDCMKHENNHGKNGDSQTKAVDSSSGGINWKKGKR